ncbi:alpha/beta hydrolase [Emticicia sp. W12TSBA100-4]|uniref:alpha/beta hydrolase n=1 Tax=Emticicia sp. W12TSBA100-4 TaxID=3160965 RepID=UPI003306591B
MKNYFIIGLMLLLSSCDRVDVVPLFNKNYSIQGEEEIDIEYEVRKNEKYGDNELQNYDIYLPKNQPDKVPVVVLLHGGGWSEGDKGFINPIVETLRQKRTKCAIVNTNYRLTFQQGITYREQLADIDSLLKKLQKDAKSLNIAPKFFLLGISAGGHLAMLYSYTSDDKNLVEVVGGIASPADLTSEQIRQGRMNSDIIKLVGKPFSNETIGEYRSASPLFQMKKTSPATILFYGGSDTIVPPEQGEKMQKKLEELGDKHKYYFYPELYHEWGKLPETLDIMLEFADKHL